MFRQIFIGLILYLIGLPVLAANTQVTFASGKMRGTFPSTFKVVENTSSHLLLSFGPASDHSLKLTLQQLPPGLSAEETVRREGKRNGLLAFELENRVMISELGPVFDRSGLPYRSATYRIGFGADIVTMILTAPAPAATPPTAEFLEFLGKPLGNR